MFAIIWGQCSEAMFNKLHALDQYKTETKSHNCTWILCEIKGVTHQFDTKWNIFLSLLDDYTCRQTAHQTNTEYLAVFTANVQVLKYYKATVSESYLLVDNNNAALDVTATENIVRDRSLAMAFLKGADARRYGSLWTELANQKNRGNNKLSQGPYQVQLLIA
jgi:hypothetical protein